MSDNGELNIIFSPHGKTGKGVLSAKLAGEPIYTDKFDISDADAREKFKRALCKGRKGIDAEAVTWELERLAGSYVADPDGSGDEEKFTQAQALVKLAEGAELFHDGDTAYATIEADDHRENHAINLKGFRQWLSRRYWVAFKKVPGGQAMQDALAVLCGKAQYEGPSRTVAVRLAENDGAIYLDLCNDKWEAVRITPRGWDLVPDLPVKFIRRRGMLPLPMPVHGGSVNALRQLMNAGDECAWRLIMAWLVMALHPRGPYPILAVNGEQGSAKSTTCRMLRRLIDPNDADLRAAPRDDRDLMIAACNSRLVAFDNLSSIPAPLSDALCRLATGGGFATRELYTNDDEKLFSAARPILFNGIEELATRPDLLERAIVLNLPMIPEDARQTESALWQCYEQARPGILGALLDAISASLRNLATVKLECRPRMADFAEWIVAAEPALPWPLGSFLNDYRGNRDAANELTVEASAVGPAIAGMMHDLPRWEGTAKELLAELEADRHTDMRTRGRQDWPKTPKAMSNALRRIAPTLRRLGVETTFVRQSDGKRTRTIVLERIGQLPSQSSLKVPNAGNDLEIGDEPGRSRDGRDG